MKYSSTNVDGNVDFPSQEGLNRAKFIDNSSSLDKQESMNYSKTLNLPQFFKAINPSKSLITGEREEGEYHINYSSALDSKTIESFKQTIALISPNQPTCQLLTGHIGCGKSTKLRRLKAELEDEGFHVVYLESSQYLDMAYIDITDILLSIAGKVSESLAEIQIKVKSDYFTHLFRDIVDLLQIPISLDTEVSFAIGKITANNKNSPQLRQELREYLKPHTMGILDSINQEILEIAIAKLKRRGKAGLVVIVDNLDRIDNHILPSGRSLQEYLFIDRGETLRQLNCHVVYTIPLSLMFSNEVEILKNRLGGGLPPRILPMIPVRQRNGAVSQEGMALLRQIVMVRAFPHLTPAERLELITEVFDTPETLDRLCLISGGNVRNLLGILYGCLRQEDPPISRQVLEKVIRESRNYMTSSLDNDEWELLFKVLQKETVRGNWEYMTLFRGMFIYEYQDRNGIWFDINPVLKETEKYQSWLKQQEKLRQATN